MRKSLISVAAAGLALALTACGGTSTPAETPKPTDSKPASSAPPADAGSLTIWVDETRIDLFNVLGGEFKTATGVTLDVVQKPSQDIKTDFIAQVPTGEGPDLIVGAHDWVGDL